jgi:phosphoglycolate phosphatase-like HAD superfamily hydrolase
MSTQHERLFDGMAELLARPFRAAVATGKSQRGADRTVNQHGLGDRFEIVLGAHLLLAAGEEEGREDEQEGAHRVRVTET